MEMIEDVHPTEEELVENTEKIVCSECNRQFSNKGESLGWLQELHTSTRINSFVLLVLEVVCDSYERMTSDSYGRV